MSHFQLITRQVGWGWGWVADSRFSSFSWLIGQNSEVYARRKTNVSPEKSWLEEDSFLKWAPSF